MAMRLGLGPVFWYEWLRASRRWQLYALRSLFAAALAAGLTAVWWTKLAGKPTTVSLLAEVGASFFFALVGTQLAVVLLAAPAYAAGGFCVDKARGTLLHVLATDLSDTEIVLGKLAALLLPVLGLVLCGTPVLFGAALLGGIDPEAALGAVLVTLAVGVLGGTLALTLSIWGRHTYEVLLAAYLVAAAVVLAGPLWRVLQGKLGLPAAPGWLDSLNPFVVAFLPYLEPDSRFLDQQLLFLAVALGLSAALAWLAVLRVRTVALRQASQPARRRGYVLRWLRLLTDRLPGPSLDSYPVLWREWYCARPSLWTLLAWAVYGLAALVFSGMAISDELRHRRGMAPWVNALQVPFGLLLILVRAATVLSAERAQGRLDVLLTTPLSTEAILGGKWLACYRAAPAVGVLPGLVAAAATGPHGTWWGVAVLVALVLAYAAALTSLGLAVAVRVARPGRAAGACVLLFALVVIVPFLPLLLLPVSTFWEGVACASPFFGMGELTDVLTRRSLFPSSAGAAMLSWSAAWLIVYLMAALCLYRLALAGADRRLGRVSGNSSGAPFQRAWGRAR
jgi:ABC-type transport system involved in multi-copper enzyme maturation permease subunit